MLGGELSTPIGAWNLIPVDANLQSKEPQLLRVPIRLGHTP